MDPDQFTPRKTGELLKIEGISSTGRVVSDWAFIPDPLPPDWEFPRDLWPLLADAKAQLMRLDGVCRHMPAPELLLEPLQRNEAVKSSSIEGSYATVEQLLLYELNPREPTSEHDQANVWREVWNYRNALRVGHQHVLEGGVLTLEVIRRLHRELMTGVRGADKQPGEFRDRQIQIGFDRRFIPPPVDRMSRLLKQMVELARKVDRRYDPLVWAYLFHYQFESIHPFRDGNGRVGRLLIATMVSHWLGMRMPWLYISPFFERHKEEYVRYLFRVSTHGDWAKWIEFCLVGTLQQATDAIIRSDRLLLARDQLKEKVRGKGARLEAIIDALLIRPYIAIPEVARRFEVTYHTARSDVHRLVDVGLLVELKGTHPKSYVAPEIYRAAYDPTPVESGTSEPDDTHKEGVVTPHPGTMA
jgi:Fic family protein